MGRGKQIKKDEFDQYPNCVNADAEKKGKWHEFFGNENPIVLELGCGKADLGYGLAENHPEWNILGVDIKAVRMWTAAKKALENDLENIGFLRCDIHQVKEYFGENEANTIWVTFPDPFPRKKHTKNRLTERKFLHQYLHILHPEGKVHFKTDNDVLFAWTLRHFDQVNQDGDLKITVHGKTDDLHDSEFLNEDTGLITDYERRFLEMGQQINYVTFSIERGPKFGETFETEKELLEGSQRAPRYRGGRLL